VVGRLDCDSSSADHRGFWELIGFGLLGIYKSDWTKIGGTWNSICYGRDKNNLMVLTEIATMQSLFNQLTRYDKHVLLLIKFLKTFKHTLFAAHDAAKKTNCSVTENRLLFIQ
jgi:hypothetical protein